MASQELNPMSSRSSSNITYNIPIFSIFFSVCIYKLIDNVHSEGHQNIREPFRTDKDYVLTRYYIIFLFG